MINSQCKECNRPTFTQIDDKGKWHTLDKKTGSSHWLVCHPDPPKYKVFDQVIVFWPRSCKSYVVVLLNEHTQEYTLTGHLDAEHKKITFNKLEDNSKLMDEIYKLLYL